MSNLYSPSTLTKDFISPINTTKLMQQLHGYNPSLDNAKINLVKGDTTQYGKIVAINSLFGVKSCLVSGKWYDERDLLPVEMKIQVKSVNKVNFVVSLVMSIIK